MADGGQRKGAGFPSQWRRYADAATELTIYRATDPVSSSSLPAYYSRAVSRNSAYLLYSSDSSGSPQACGMNLKTGATTLLTEAEALDPSSLALLPGDQSFCYATGDSVYSSALATLKERKIHSTPEPWTRAPGLSVDSTGAHVFLVERQGDRRRLRMAPVSGGEARTVLETGLDISEPLPRPRRTQILYRQQNDALWVVNSNGAGNRRLKVAPGRIGPAQWSPDGGHVLYLSFPEDSSRLNEIREYAVDTGTDKLVAKTSQYAHFGFNRDTSVFVGASRSLASPVVVILLRINGRELTLCEHKSGKPETVAPIFAPDAQRIYFQSDRGGKPAIYFVPVERLVEKIEAGRW